MRLRLIRAGTFAGVHKALVKKVLNVGSSIPTDYDKEGDAPSLDAVIGLEVTRPWDPPVFSKCVYDSAGGLLEYRDEVLYGSLDHKVDDLSYTYHNRFEGQLDGVLEELKRNGFTRRAQFITWQPEVDLGAEYPPCLQRAWFRVDHNGELEMHTIWRSRDIWKAWGSNVFAFAHLHKQVAEWFELGIGSYIEFIDSAHIYGEDIRAARNAVKRGIGDWMWPLEDIENNFNGIRR